MWPFHCAIRHFTLNSYEYNGPLEKEEHAVAKTIAQLGEDGWEMVGFAPLIERGPGSMGLPVANSGAMVFKRPKPDMV